MAETWYSIGGGFVKKEGEETEETASVQLPFPINTASDLLHWCRKTGLAISEVVLENEAAWRPEDETRQGYRADLENHAGMYLSGLSFRGNAAGRLACATAGGEPEQAACLATGPMMILTAGWRLSGRGVMTSNIRLDWVSCFALAVNEENASFGRVVTAPTNGAAGVIPAVLQYFRHLLRRASREQDPFLYTRRFRDRQHFQKRAPRSPRRWADVRRRSGFLRRWLLPL